MGKNKNVHPPHTYTSFASTSHSLFLEQLNLQISSRLHILTNTYTKSGILITFLGVYIFYITSKLFTLSYIISIEPISLLLGNFILQLLLLITLILLLYPFPFY